MSFKLAIFDLDGTLVDTRHDIAAAVNSSLSKRGFPFLDVETITDSIGNGLDQMLKAITQFPDDKIEEFREDFLLYYDNHIADYSTPYPDIEILLKELKINKIQCAVLTNKLQKSSEKLLEALNLLSYFDIIAGSDRYNSIKPDPGGLLKILKEVQVKPEQAVMIGDGDADILVAQTIGVSSIAVTYGFKSETVLKPLNPDYLAPSVGAVRQILIPDILNSK